MWTVGTWQAELYFPSHFFFVASCIDLEVKRANNYLLLIQGKTGNAADRMNEVRWWSTSDVNVLTLYPWGGRGLAKERGWGVVGGGEEGRTKWKDVLEKVLNTRGIGSVTNSHWLLKGDWNVATLVPVDWVFCQARCEFCQSSCWLYGTVER